MAHPVIWARSYDFQPIGHSPPVSLVRDIPPEADADILMVGCGDARNLLYTIYSCCADDPVSTRSLDFTCCDSEPAVLARNILFYTLLLRKDFEVKKPLIWNILYNFFLDQQAIALLVEQCSSLTVFAKDFKTWHASPYSRCIKIGSLHTLQELQRHWDWYARTAFWSDSHRAFVKAKVINYLKKHAKYYRGYVNTRPARATGELWLNSALHMNEAFHRYWERGGMFNTDKDFNAATYVNPTFAFSNDNEMFATNDLTAPLGAFLLAGSFCPLFPSKSEEWPNPTLNDLYDACRAQFYTWCHSLRTSLRAENKLIIRVIYADALAFGLTVQEYFETGRTSIAHRVAPWHAAFLVLDGDGYDPSSSEPTAPLTFDVIDTSNMCEKLGFINVFTATIPLLKQTPWATLYSETDDVHGDDPTKDSLVQLCGDVGTMSLLFDLVPTSYLSGFRTEGNTQELLCRQVIPNPTGFLERLTWRRPSGLTPGLKKQSLVFESAHLTNLLFNIYIRMFQREAVSPVDETEGSERERSRPHYCRRTFVHLIRYLVGRIATDWNAVAVSLIERMQGPTLMIGKISAHDFVCQLHQLGVHTDFLVQPDSPLLWDCKKWGRMRGWTDIPTAVYVAVAVPRSTFNILDRRDTPRNPPISAGVGSVAGSESYHFVAIETFFGTMEVEGRNEHARAYVTEDPQGRSGNSPVIVTFCVPSHVLARPPGYEMSIRLLVLKTPHTDPFYEKYGNVGRFFDISSKDPRVHVLAKKPCLRKDAGVTLEINPPIKRAQASPESPRVALDSTFTKTSTLTIRATGREWDVKLALSDKATAVTFKQVGPSVVRLLIGSKSHQDATFPFPVDGSKTRIRISRREGWIEVIGPISTFTNLRGDLVPQRFQMIHGREGMVTPWGLHRVWLSRMPQISMATPSLLQWINRFVEFAISAEEAESVRKRQPGALTLVKQTTCSIYKTFIGAKDAPGKSTVFLTSPSGDIEYTFFLSSLRLDLSAHTIVLDSFVIRTTGELAESLRTAINTLRPFAYQITISEDESAAWKALIPALVERCRDWRHSSECSYAKDGQQAPSSNPAEHICDCGRGKDTDTIGAKQEWAPFAPHATRLALSPLFAVSYLETVCKRDGEEVIDMFDEHDVPLSELRSLTREGGRDTDDSNMFCAACLYWLPPGKRKVCKGCKKVVYCSKGCQWWDWRQQKHKEKCAGAARARRK